MRFKTSINPKSKKSRPPYIRKEQPKRVRRLFWDIEVSPNVGFFWRSGFKLAVGPDSIIVERKIICIAYKWEGEAPVTVLRWDSNQDDESLIRKFVPILNSADEAVAHYGDGFDMPWFKGRMIILGLPPLGNVKTVDTKAWAAKYFYFNSNKLDYLGKIFGYGGKLETKYQLWIDIVLHKCHKALDYMAKYCGVDVIKLEKVYKRFQPWMTAKTHAGVLAGHDKWSCSSCGSKNVRKSKTKVSASGTVTHQMLCNDCHHYHPISEKAYQDYQEAKRV